MQLAWWTMYCVCLLNQQHKSKWTSSSNLNHLWLKVEECQILIIQIAPVPVMGIPPPAAATVEKCAEKSHFLCVFAWAAAAIGSAGWCEPHKEPCGSCVHARFAAQRTEAGSGTDGAGAWMDCYFWSGFFHSVWRALARACLERSDANVSGSLQKRWAMDKGVGIYAVSSEIER